MRTSTRNPLARPGWGGALLGLWLAAGLSGCGSLLDVSNPNNVTDADAHLPVAAKALVDGSQGAVATALPSMALLSGTSGDEFDWSGSRDGWNELDHGNVHNPQNEFLDGAFPTVAQARWLADEAVKTLEGHLAKGALSDITQLARAYLYRAIIYTSIADQWEDFALSDRGTPAPPVGKSNMSTFYDEAVSACDKGLAVAGISATLSYQLTATKARAQFSKSIWQQLHTSPIPLGAVSNATAAGTAAAAMALAPSSDYKMQFTYSSATVGTDYRAWVNQRQEMRIGKAYAAPDPSGKPTWTYTVLKDPITNDTDVVVSAAQRGFKAASYPAFTVVSNREMRLIIAENALATGDTATFATQVNAIRALDGLTGAKAWSRAAPQVPALTMLMHERRVNLFLQGRRMLDHYRFGPSTYPVDWINSSTAVTAPGTLFPITLTECLANTYITAANCGK